MSNLFPLFCNRAIVAFSWIWNAVTLSKLAKMLAICQKVAESDSTAIVAAFVFHISTAPNNLADIKAANSAALRSAAIISAFKM